MIRRPPRSTLFPTPPLSRPRDPEDAAAGPARGDGPTGTRRRDQGHEGGARSPDGGRYGPPGRWRATYAAAWARRSRDRKSTRLNSSHANISYAVFCLKKKKK